MVMGIVSTCVDCDDLDCQPLSPFGSSAFDYQFAPLRSHSGTKAMSPLSLKITLVCEIFFHTVNSIRNL